MLAADTAVSVQQLFTLQQQCAVQVPCRASGNGAAGSSTTAALGIELSSRVVRAGSGWEQWDGLVGVRCRVLNVACVCARAVLDSVIAAAEGSAAVCSAPQGSNASGKIRQVQQHNARRVVGRMIGCRMAGGRVC